jgi:hypothetical protein
MNAGPSDLLVFYKTSCFLKDDFHSQNLSVLYFSVNTSFFLCGGFHDIQHYTLCTRRIDFRHTQTHHSALNLQEAIVIFDFQLLRPSPVLYYTFSSSKCLRFYKCWAYCFEYYYISMSLQLQDSALDTKKISDDYKPDISLSAPKQWSSHGRRSNWGIV